MIFAKIDLDTKSFEELDHLVQYDLYIFVPWLCQKFQLNFSPKWTCELIETRLFWGVPIRRRCANGWHGISSLFIGHLQVVEATFQVLISAAAQDIFSSDQGLELTGAACTDQKCWSHGDKLCEIDKIYRHIYNI